MSRKFQIYDRVRIIRGPTQYLGEEAVVMVILLSNSDEPVYKLCSAELWKTNESGRFEHLNWSAENLELVAAPVSTLPAAAMPATSSTSKYARGVAALRCAGFSVQKSMHADVADELISLSLSITVKGDAMSAIGALQLAIDDLRAKIDAVQKQLDQNDCKPPTAALV